MAAVLTTLVALWPTELSGYRRLFIQVTMVLFLGSVVVREDHWLRPVLALRPLAYIGVISYCPYLYHMWAIYHVRAVFTRFGWNVASFSFFFCSMASSLLVASHS